MDYYSSSRQNKLLPPVKSSNMPGFRSSEATYSTNEKTISCSVCLARVPAKLIDKHEMQCRQDALNKKTKNGGVRKGGNSYAPPSRSSRNPPEPEYTPSPVISRPLTLMCYICGREYGTRSLRIHLKTCKEKWDIEQGNSVLKNRRPMPQAPPGFEELINKDNITRKDIQNYNNRAFDAYNYEVLVPCKNCGRTFKPESLIPHQKSCKPSNPLKPLSNAQKEYQAERMMNNLNPNPSGNQDLVPCRKCGRTFASDRISKHESVCKPGPTKQALRKQKQLAVKSKSNGYFSSQKTSNWRQQHEDFQNSIIAMRMGGGSQAKQGNNRPTVSSQYPQFSQPKSFSTSKSRLPPQETSQRHIVNCKNLGQKSSQSPGVSFGKDTVFAKSPNQPKSSIRKPSQNIFEDVDDDYDSIPSYATPARSLISKNYPSLNSSNIRSTSSRTNNAGLFSIQKNDRDSWMKPMGQKQQKTHDMLYGIGAFSGPPLSNNSPFPAPSGYGGYR